MKCKAALEAAEAAQKIAEREAQRRINAERKALREAEERKKIMTSLSGNDCSRYIQFLDLVTCCARYVFLNHNLD